MRRRTAATLLSCALALAIAGCGSDGGTIPEEDGQDLLSLLAATQDAVTAGECDRAQEFAGNFVSETEQLPESVDPEVAEELTNAGANLADLANDPEECEGIGASGETGAESEAPTTEETDPVEPTDTTETDTTDEETSEEPETAEEPAQPEEEQPSEQPPPTDQNPTPGGGEPPSGGVQPGGGAG